MRQHRLALLCLWVKRKKKKGDSSGQPAAEDNDLLNLVLLPGSYYWYSSLLATMFLFLSVMLPLSALALKTFLISQVQPFLLFHCPEIACARACMYLKACVCVDVFVHLNLCFRKIQLLKDVYVRVRARGARACVCVCVCVYVCVCVCVHKIVSTHKILRFIYILYYYYCCYCCCCYYYYVLPLFRQNGRVLSIQTSKHCILFIVYCSVDAVFILTQQSLPRQCYQGEIR